MSDRVALLPRGGIQCPYEEVTSEKRVAARMCAPAG